MSTEQIFFEVIKIALAVTAAGFTYFQFFTEGKHKQRIQFDIDCQNLGIVGKERIVEIGCVAENKGNVEQVFDDIRVEIRGIDDNTTLSEIEGHEPRLAFHKELSQASLVSDNWDYYFVRPHVTQRFPLVVKLPSDISHVHIRSTFRYKGTKDIHSAERAFAFH